MKYDIYFIEVGFHLSYLDPKFKGKTNCVPLIGDFIDYEINYEDDCVIISGKVVERIHYLQDDKVELRVEISDRDVVGDLFDYIKATNKGK